MSYAGNRAYLAQVAADVDDVAAGDAGAAAARRSRSLLPQLNAVRAVVGFGEPISGRRAVGDALGAVSGRLGRQRRARRLPAGAGRHRAAAIRGARQAASRRLRVGAGEALRLPEGVPDARRSQAPRQEAPPVPGGSGVENARRRARRGHVAVEALPEPARIQRHAAPDRPGSGARRAGAQHDSAGVDPADHVRAAAARFYGDDKRRAAASTSSPASASRRCCRRKSGRRLSEPVPSFYTKAVFKEVTRPSAWLPLVKQFAEDDWVWGAGARCPPRAGRKLTSQVTDLYERDYNSAWDDLLNDLEIVSFSTVQQYADALGILVGPTSPLRGTPEDRRRQHVAGGGGRAGGRGAAVSHRSRAGSPKARRICFNAAQKKVTGTSGVAAGHGHHAALPADPPLHGGSARADRRDLRADSQDSRAAAQAGSASRRRQSAEGARRSRAARPPAGAAAGRGEPAAAGQHAGRPDRAERRRQRQLGRDARAREAVSGGGRRASAARGSRAAIRSAARATCR